MELLKGIRGKRIVFIPDPSNDQKFVEIKGSIKFPGICINHHKSKDIPKGYEEEFVQDYQSARFYVFQKHLGEVRTVESTDDQGVGPSATILGQHLDILNTHIFTRMNDCDKDTTIRVCKAWGTELVKF